MKKGIYLISIIAVSFLSIHAAYTQIAIFALFELIDINENTKTK